MVNLLRPRKSLGSLSNKDKAFPLPLPKGSSTPGKQVRGDEESRWSGENLAPSDGYSGLFASGLGFKVEREGPRMPKRRNEPPPTAFPSSSKHHTRASTHTHGPAPAHIPAHVLATPGRRRRSSILTSGSTSPSKYKTSSTNQSVDAALEGVMRSLKKMSTFSHTPSPQKQQSRWSISSDETERSAPHAQPRPSMDSVRSKISGAMSIRSRKSEERLRPSMDELMEVDGEEVPPVPCMPTRQVPAIPTTPKRLRGLRRLLTPKKKQQIPIASESHPMPCLPTTPSTSAKFNLPQPPAERALPKKSSFASIRSLAKKGSSTTMRSLFRDRDDNEPIPCLPHPPTTPSRHNGTDRGFPLISKKGSSTTMRSLFRDRDSNEPVPCLPHPSTTPSRHRGTDRGFPVSKKGSSNTLRGMFVRDENEVPPCLPFPTTPSRHNCGNGARPAKSSIGPPQARPATSPSKFLQDMPRRAPLTPKKDDDEDTITFGGTPDLSFGSNTTPSTGRQATPMVFTPSFVLSDINPNVSSSHANINNDSAQSTPSMTPLTAKAQRERSTRPFGKPLHHLLPRQARYNNGLETPPPQQATTTSSTGPVRGLPPRPALTASSFRISERRYDPTYSIINSYSRPSMGPGNTAFAKRDPSSGTTHDRFKANDNATGDAVMPFTHGVGDGWDTPMPMPFPQPQPNSQSNSSGYFTQSHIREDTGTFGRRSVTTNHDKSIEVDFTASPDPNLSFSTASTAAYVSAIGSGPGYRDRTISNASSDGVSQEWELEAYLKEVEARERRANVI